MSPRTTPPEVQSITARWQGILDIVGKLTDWLGIGAVCYLANMKVIDGNTALGAIVFLATGTLVGKWKGSGGGGSGSTTAAVALLMIKGGIVGLGGAVKKSVLFRTQLKGT